MNYLGFMWADRGEHLDKAEELIRKANELMPDDAAYIDSLGWLYFRQGKNEEALAELQHAEQLLKEIEPEDAEILDHIAQVHDKLGHRAKAEEYWKRTLALKPQNEKLVQSVEKSLGISKPKPPPKNEPPVPEKKP
jgi:tetratricopeptide (TPR) repeat protein